GTLHLLQSASPYWYFLLIIFLRLLNFEYVASNGHGMPCPYGLELELLPGGFGLAADFGQDLFFAKDEELLVVEFDFRAAVLAEEDAVAWFHVERDQFTLFALAGADCDDFALHGLFFCGVRD